MGSAYKTVSCYSVLNRQRGLHFFSLITFIVSIELKRSNLIVGRHHQLSKFKYIIKVFLLLQRWIASV